MLQYRLQALLPILSKLKNCGFSLVELLVSMGLGLTLAAVVLQIYVGNSWIDREREARLRIQENGRFGLNFLAQEIRMGGYLGCLGGLEAARINNILIKPPVSFQPQFGVQGWEATGTNPGAINNSLSDVTLVNSNSGSWATTGGNVIPDVKLVPGSDLIRIWSVSGSPGPVSAIWQAATPTIEVATAIDIEVNDFLLISDCVQADIVQACAVKPSAGRKSRISLSTACRPGNAPNSTIASRAPAEVMKLEASLLYIGKRGDKATNPPALFRRQLNASGSLGNPQELIEGVENMQILYGVNLDSDGRHTVDSYLPANLVPDWNNVISVRLSLLMQSLDAGSLPSPQAYSFDGVTYDGSAGNGALPVDTRIRRVFSNTISLRNRAL